MKPLFFFLERLLLVALFVGGVIVVITFVLQLDGAQTQAEPAMIAEPIADAPVAEVQVEAAAAPARSFNPDAINADTATVCRNVPGTAPLTVCLRSNGSGTMTVENGGQTFEYVYAFYTDGETCPTAPQGFVTDNRRMTTQDLLDFGFSQADIDALGLPGRYCAFSAAA